MQNIIGSSHEHMAFQILLHISDDRDFLCTLQTSKQMRNIASHQRIWKERMELYYPEYRELRLQTGLACKEFYPVASLIFRIAHQKKKNEQMYPIKKLADYIVNVDIDCDLIYQKIRHYGVHKTIFINCLCNKYKSPKVKSEKTFRLIVDFIKLDISFAHEIFSFFKYHNPKILFEIEVLLHTPTSSSGKAISVMNSVLIG